MSNFNDFNLDERLLKALAGLGYEKPTPIQERAIPKVLGGADLIASAQTGTGKTAAFMVPALNKLISSPKPKSNRPRILVLAPTRELAMQISTVTEKYTKLLSQVKTVCIYGGVGYAGQLKAMSRPYEILIATPGRLMDHMQQGKVDLSGIEFLILDEADRMLDMGFIEAVERIAEATPENRQTLLFSATLDTSILRLSKKLQNNPEEILVEQTQEDTSNIEQRLYYVDGMSHKMRLLDRLLEDGEIKQSIIFISTRNAADSLAERLHEMGHVTEALHGNMSQRQRSKAIAKLRHGEINILVATDVAARGIDILTISHVINIDLPFQAEDYIHRIGRTGRAGGKGVAITFATYREEPAISKINRLIANPMVPHTIEGFEPSAKGKGGSSAPQSRGRFGQRGDRRGNDSPRPRREFNSDRPSFNNQSERRSFKKDSAEPREFNREPGKPKEFGFSSDKPRSFKSEPWKKKEFGSSPDRSRDFKANPWKKKEFGFSSDKPRSFGGPGEKRKDFGFSSDKPRSFGGPGERRKDFGFSADKPRGFKSEPWKKKEFGPSSDKPRSFNSAPGKRKDFGFASKKPRGFNSDPVSRGKKKPASDFTAVLT